MGVFFVLRVKSLSPSGSKAPLRRYTWRASPILEHWSSQSISLLTLLLCLFSIFGASNTCILQLLSSQINHPKDHFFYVLYPHIPLQ